MQTLFIDLRSHFLLALGLLGAVAQADCNLTPRGVACHQECRSNIDELHSMIFANRRKISEASEELAIAEKNLRSIQSSRETLAEAQSGYRSALHAAAHEHERYRKQAQELRPQMERLKVARQSYERQVPEQVASVRALVETTDSQLDEEIEALRSRLAVSRLEEDVEALAERIEQLEALKLFRIRSGGNVNASELLEAYLAGKSEEAVAYASPKLKPILVSTRALYLDHLKGMEAILASGSEMARILAEAESQVEKWRQEGARIEGVMAANSSRIDELDSRLQDTHRAIQGLRDLRARQADQIPEYERKINGWEDYKRVCESFKSCGRVEK